MQIQKVKTFSSQTKDKIVYMDKDPNTYYLCLDNRSIAAKSDCKVKNVSSRVLVHVGQSVADMKRELSKVQKHKLTSPMGWII